MLLPGFVNFSRHCRCAIKHKCFIHYEIPLCLCITASFIQHFPLQQIFVQNLYAFDLHYILSTEMFMAAPIIMAQTVLIFPKNMQYDIFA